VRKIGALSKIITALFLSSIPLATSSIAHASTTAALPSASKPLIALMAMDKNGNPLQNANVEVFLMNGSNVSNQSPVITATTDSNGVANVFFAPTSSQIALADQNNGYFNFSVVVSDPSGAPDVYNFTYHLPDAETNSSESMNGSVSQVKDSSPVGVQLSPYGGHKPWVEGKNSIQSMTAPTQSMAALQPNDQTCQWMNSMVSSTEAYTTVGELHNAEYGSATFTYGYGGTADSTIGVGYSSNGTSGWSADGTFHVSNTYGAQQTRTQTSPDTGYQVKTEFTYDKYEWQQYCAGVPTGAAPYYTVEANTWDGGMEWGANVSQYDGHEASYSQYAIEEYPNSTFTRSSNTAYTYSAGVSVFGATLSATSGFSQYVQESWTFPANGGVSWLYGHDGAPTYSTIIYAQ